MSESLDTPKAWYSGLSKYHWLVFTICSLGWGFDCLDQQLFNLARKPALAELIGVKEAHPDVALYGGYATAIMLVGWATGGIIFGIMGDKYGRARTMVWTILSYSLFTGLCGLSQTQWDFMVFRFLTGLGVGGQFAVGATLLTESVPSHARSRLLGLLQIVASISNCFAAVIGLVFVYMKHHGMIEMSPWRYMFLIGILPALLTIFVIRYLKEPEAWKHEVGADKRKGGSLRELFGTPIWRKHAIFGASLAACGVIGLWGIGLFSPDLNRGIVRGNAENAARVRETGNEAKWDQELLQTVVRSSRLLDAVRAKAGEENRVDPMALINLTDERVSANDPTAIFAAACLTFDAQMIKLLEAQANSILASQLKDKGKTVNDFDPVAKATIKDPVLTSDGIKMTLQLEPAVPLNELSITADGVQEKIALTPDDVLAQVSLTPQAVLDTLATDDLAWAGLPDDQVAVLRGKKATQRERCVKYLAVEEAAATSPEETTGPPIDPADPDDPIAEPATESATDPAEPATDPPVEPTEPISEPAVDPTSDPATTSAPTSESAAPSQQPETTTAATAEAEFAAAPVDGTLTAKPAAPADADAEPVLSAPPELAAVQSLVDKINLRQKNINYEVGLWGSYTLFLFMFGSIFGIYAFTIFAERIGRRPTFTIFFFLALVVTVMTFLFMRTTTDVLWMVPLMGFFQLSLFGGYTILFPELFPTRLRSTSVSFCYNIARFVAAAGPLGLGALAKNVFASSGGDAIRYAGAWMSCIFILGMIIVWFLPETRGKPLPE